MSWRGISRWTSETECFHIIIASRLFHKEGSLLGALWIMSIVKRVHYRVHERKLLDLSTTWTCDPTNVEKALHLRVTRVWPLLYCHQCVVRLLTPLNYRKYVEAQLTSLKTRIKYRYLVKYINALHASLNKWHGILSPCKKHRAYFLS